MDKRDNTYKAHRMANNARAICNTWAGNVELSHVMLTEYIRQELDLDRSKKKMLCPCCDNELTHHAIADSHVYICEDSADDDYSHSCPFVGLEYYSEQNTADIGTYLKLQCPNMQSGICKHQRPEDDGKQCLMCSDESAG